MVSRKLSNLDEHILESFSDSRSTRPRLVIDQDLPLFLFVSPEPLPPPPQPLAPPLVNTDQDDPKTKLTMSFYVDNTDNNINNNNNINNSVLSTQKPPPSSSSSPPPPPPENPLIILPHAPRRIRKKPSHAPRQGKPAVIPPPFPWATDRRCKVHTLKYLTQTLMIKTITGDVECKRCQKGYQIEYNLEQKYSEVSDYVRMHLYDFHDRAPAKWMSPVLPTCKFCHQENSMKPVINKKKMINWLFLLLGQMVGCCTLGQLKYFCKHTGNHRTGAKDRVLFLAYQELCKQIDGGGS